MNSFRFRKNNVGRIVSVLVFIGLMAVGNASFAQATRTWVSGVGDDANPCSRTAPCKTFAGAISKTAAGGEIDTMDPGGFGAVTITKAMTINGEAEGGIVVSGTNGIVVSAGVNDVVRIRNLNINGLSSGLAGIRFNTGAVLHVENVQIYGFTGYAVDFLPTGASELFIKDSKFNNNLGASGGGLEISPGASGAAMATIDNLRVDNNTTGIVVRNGVIAAIRNSVASGDHGNGIIAVTTTGVADVVVENCLISNNGFSPGAAGGVWASGPNSTIRISDNVITNNEYGVNVGSGGHILSFGDNKIVGNTIDGNPTGTLMTK